MAVASPSNPSAVEAWQSAVKRFEDVCGSKVVGRLITQETKPKQLLDYICERQQKKSRSKFRRLLKRISSIGERFARYQSALDVLAQGTPSPGCLIWGSIRMVLELVKGYADAFERLLEALETIGNRLPIIELYTELYCELPLFQDYLVRFYTSLVGFWSQALKFYNRKKWLGCIRSTWSNYDSEFKKLEFKMEQHGQLIGQCANALQAQRAERHEDKTEELWKKEKRSSLTRWLCPTNHEKDLASARKLLQEGTCHWIVETPQFQAWAGEKPTSLERLLWISAVPGAGKTVLSSFLIEHLRRETFQISRMTLFFMFERRNLNKNTSLSAACSFIHQLLLVLSQEEGDQFMKELSEHKDQCGQRKADDSDSLWRLVRMLLEHLSSVALVLDALDECEDYLPLMDHLIQLCSSSSVRIIILSRRERNIAQQLQARPEIRIHDRHNNDDILRFLDKQIAGCSKLSLPNVSALVLQSFGVELKLILLDRANGSFLWAALVIEELRRKQTPSEIVETLKTTPPGVEALYESILVRYRNELDKDTRKICRAVLRWLACATRPLCINEVWEALRVEYTLLASGSSTDEGFFLTRREMVDSCGSLVREENKTLLLAHLSLSEFLRKPLPAAYPSLEVQEFSMNLSEASWKLALTSLQYITTCSKYYCSGSLDRYRRLNLPRMTNCRYFMEYAVTYWLIHLSNSEVIFLHKAPTVLSTFCLSTSMLFWLEVWFSLGRQNLWLLEKQLRNIALKTSASTTSRVQLGRDAKDLPFMYRWSVAMLQLLERHGPCCEKEPSYLHFVDPLSFEEDSGDRGDKGIFALFVPNEPQLHSQHVRLNTQAHQQPREPAADLPFSNAFNTHFSHRVTYAFGVFSVHKQSNVIFFGDYMSTAPKLFCQDMSTGRILAPTVHPYDEGRSYWCEGYALSKDGKYLAICYRSIPYTGTTILGDDEKHHVVLWEMTDHFDFDDPNATSWCTIKKMVTGKSRKSDYSPQPVAFGNDGTLFCPYGRFESCSKLIDRYSCPSKAHMVGNLDALKNATTSGGLAYSADTLDLVLCDTELKRLVKFQGHEMTFDTVVQLRRPNVAICCISPRGRYVVWRERSMFQPCFLHDFVTNTTKYLQGSEGVLFPTQSLLVFSADEECLFGVLTPSTEFNYHKRYFSIWKDISEKPQQQVSAVVGEILGIYFTTLQQPAYLATRERWAEIDPSRLETVAQQFLPRSLVAKQQASTKGDCLAVVSYIPERLGQSKWRVELMRLDEPFKSKVFQLQSSNDNIEPLACSQVCIDLSQDLMLLVIDVVCYYLPEHLETAVTIRLPDVQTEHSSALSFAYDLSHRDRSRLRSSFSVCHSWISRTNSGSLQPQRRPSLELYHLRLAKARASKVDIFEHLPLLTFRWLDTAFHPRAPVLAVVAMNLDHPWQSSGYHLTFTCYVVAPEQQNSSWLKIDKDLVKEHGDTGSCIHDVVAMNVSFSDCGAYIILGKGSASIEPRSMVWDLPEYVHDRQGAVSLLRTIQPNQHVYSSYWGNSTTYLDCRCTQGQFTNIIPVVIIDDQNKTGIKLLYLCKDRHPEMMILHETWDSLVTQLRASLRTRLSLDVTDSRLNDLASMLALSSEAN